MVNLYDMGASCEMFFRAYANRIKDRTQPACQHHSLRIYAFSITKISLYKYTENSTTKNEICLDKNFDIFFISAQNTDCGYSLEPPR